MGPASGRLPPRLTGHRAAWKATKITADKQFYGARWGLAWLAGLAGDGRSLARTATHWAHRTTGSAALPPQNTTADARPHHTLRAPTTQVVSAGQRSTQASSMAGCLVSRTSPHIALVQHIVMHQAGGVQHLADFSQPPVPLSDVAAMGRASGAGVRWGL